MFDVIENNYWNSYIKILQFGEYTSVTFQKMDHIKKDVNYLI